MISRRGFLLGSAAAIATAAPVVRALAAVPVYGGEIGTWNNLILREMVDFPFVAHDDLLAATRYSFDVLTGKVRGDPIPASEFFISPSDRSLWDDIRDGV